MKTVPPSSSPEALIFVAVIAILFVIWVFKKPKRGRNWRSSNDYRLKAGHQRGGNNFDLQLDERKQDDIQHVLGATFQKKRLLNVEEYRLFQQLEGLIDRNTQGFRLFAQVSLGEILQSSDRAAFSTINSKRCDFLIIDRHGNALVVIEYHGRGHFQGDSSHRDEVKRLALRKASIPTVEILFDYEWLDVESELKKELGEVFSPI
jgi:hypothetical protein